MDIVNLSQEEYDAAIAAADLVCKTVNKHSKGAITLPSDVQRQLKVVPHGCGTHCCCQKVVYLPCGLNHYPTYPPAQTYPPTNRPYPWTYPYGTISVIY